MVEVRGLKLGTDLTQGSAWAFPPETLSASWLPGLHAAGLLGGIRFRRFEAGADPE